MKQKNGAEPTRSGLSSSRHLIHLIISLSSSELATFTATYHQWTALIFFPHFFPFYSCTLPLFCKSSGIPIHTFRSLLIFCQICPVSSLVLMSPLFPISIPPTMPTQSTHTDRTLLGVRGSKSGEGRAHAFVLAWTLSVSGQIKSREDLVDWVTWSATRMVSLITAHSFL